MTLTVHYMYSKGQKVLQVNHDHDDVHVETGSRGMFFQSVFEGSSSLVLLSSLDLKDVYCSSLGNALPILALVLVMNPEVSSSTCDSCCVCFDVLRLQKSWQ